jgi:hypothetical protein
MPLATHAETNFGQIRKLDKGGLPFSSHPALILFSEVSKDRVRRRPSGVSTLARLAGGCEEEEEEELLLLLLLLLLDSEKETLRSLLSFFFFFFFCLTTGSTMTSSGSLSLSEEELSEEDDELEELEELELEIFLRLDILLFRVSCPPISPRNLSTPNLER